MMIAAHIMPRASVAGPIGRREGPRRLGSAGRPLRLATGSRPAIQELLLLGRGPGPHLWAEWSDDGGESALDRWLEGSHSGLELHEAGATADDDPRPRAGLGVGGFDLADQAPPVRAVLGMLSGDTTPASQLPSCSGVRIHQRRLLQPRCGRGVWPHLDHEDGTIVVDCCDTDRLDRKATTECPFGMRLLPRGGAGNPRQDAVVEGGADPREGAGDDHRGWRTGEMDRAELQPRDPPAPSREDHGD